MKRLFLLIFLIGISFRLSAQDFSSLIYRMVPNTVDIRSIGMGKTESAGNTGSNAAFGNPSLLALQQNGSIKIGSTLHFGFQKDEYADKSSDLGNYELQYGYKPNFKFTNISAALPFQIDVPSAPISMGFGAGYQNAIDMSITRYSKRESNSLSNFSQNESTVKIRGGLNTISPAMAVGLFNRISTGISINIGFGKTKIEQSSSTHNLTTESNSELTATIPGKSFSTSFGFTGKPLENLTIGTSITPPFKWKWDDIEVESESNGNDNPDREYAGGEFTIPLKFSVGCEYQITPNFSLAVEYQTRPFESFELDADTTLPGEDYYGNLRGHESMIKTMDLKNGHVLHAGMEIFAENVPFRFGFFLEPYPHTSRKVKNNQSKSEEKPDYMLGGTFGFSAPAGKMVFIELAAQYGLLKYTTTGTNLSTGSGLKEYDYKEHHLRADLGIRIDLPSLSSNKSSAQNSSTPASSSPTNQPSPQFNPENTPANVPPQDYNQPDNFNSPQQSIDENNSGF